MAVQSVIDITADLNSDGRSQLDVGGFDYAEIQLVSPNTTASFEGTSDAGDIQGVSDGNATSATNWTSLQGTNLATGTGVTSLATSGTVKFTAMPRFIRVIGGGLTATKALVRLFKIN